MYAGKIEQLPNRVNNTGYHKIDELRGDYRQNINNKIDNFIFDNPHATQYNPILHNNNNNTNNNNTNNINSNNINSNTKDTRMIIQDSSKDYYRQETNSRLSQYSPLYRSSYIPIDMANMSVNDYYTNNNTNTNTNTNNTNTNTNNTNNTNNNNTNNTNNNNTNNNNTNNNNTKYTKPVVWNASDVNIKKPNVVYNNLPIMSNNTFN